MVKDTIAALATGDLPSGIAVIRISGPKCKYILGVFSIKVPVERKLSLVDIVEPDTNHVIDQGMVFFTAGPRSFTGEDILELHVHGSIAVVQKLLDVIISIENVRIAQAGEFSRRAFENGRMDLSEIDGLGDLLQAETEGQRQQAIARYSGGLTQIVDSWRRVLVQNLSLLEAYLDFSDEDDVSGLDVSLMASELSDVAKDIEFKIEGFKYGRIVRKGFRVGIVGLPNVGKSSIINALTRSNRAIVTDEMGTTRDIQEVQLDLGGRLVLLLDSAGIRQTESKAEQEGVRRSFEMASACDLLLWVSAGDVADSEIVPDFEGCNVVHVRNKSDLCNSSTDSAVNICASEGDIDALECLIVLEYDQLNHSGGVSLISRERDVEALNVGLLGLKRAIGKLVDEGANADLELVAEDLRHCIFSLQRLLGRVDAEDVLDRVFAGFCIGK